MSTQRWKRAEREIAAVVGGERLPNTGVGQCDVRTPGWAIQVKTRTELPAWLWAAVDQAARDAGPSEAPAVVLNEVSRGRKARRLVVLDLAIFAALIGDAGGRAPPGGPMPPAVPGGRGGAGSAEELGAHGGRRPVRSTPDRQVPPGGAATPGDEEPVPTIPTADTHPMEKDHR